MQQYQQEVSERAQLQAENEKLKKDLEGLKDLKKQLDDAKRQLASLKAGAGRGQAELAAAQAAGASSARNLADTNEKLQQLIARFKETVATLQGVETERAQVQQQLAQSRGAYDKCAQTNVALYQVTSDVLDRYAHQGAFSYVARAEPFTRIKRTEIDNLVLEYKQRADELRVKPETAAAHAKPGEDAAHR
jgi:chromosome segregation ATPase